MTKFAPLYKDVKQAHKRMNHVVVKTPVLSIQLDDTHYFLKCENLQRTGAFKFRGAYNALAQFSDKQRAGGVLTYSSGNHAQAIAHAAAMLRIKATIIMPLDAPAAKRQGAEGFGATIVPYDRYKQDRDEVADAILRDHPEMTLIPPYDHPDVIAGQGTAVKELLEETGPLDAIFVPLGGGGLLAGSLLAAEKLAPKCKVFGVEPEAGNDGQLSLQKGEVVHIETPVTIADGAQTTHLGTYSFEIIKRLVSNIKTATDKELVTCVRWMAKKMKMVVEPTGCLALAAAFNCKAETHGKNVGVIISGGNVDLEKYAEYLVSDPSILSGGSGGSRGSRGSRVSAESGGSIGSGVQKLSI